VGKLGFRESLDELISSFDQNELCRISKSFAAFVCVEVLKTDCQMRKSLPAFSSVWGFQIWKSEEIAS